MTHPAGDRDCVLSCQHKLHLPRSRGRWNCEALFREETFLHDLVGNTTKRENVLSFMPSAESMKEILIEGMNSGFDPKVSF